MSRLKELIDEFCPDGVEYRKFDEVCILKARIGWQRLTKAEHLSDGEYMLVTGTDFADSHTVNYETCVYVDRDRYEQDQNIQLRDGDVLITKDGTLGKVAIVENLPMPATLNGGVFVVRPKSGELIQRYILHYLTSNHFIDAVENQHTGSTIKHLTQAIFSRLLIPIPPIEVQREIVRVLDAMHELEDSLIHESDLRQIQLSALLENLLTYDDYSEHSKPLGDICAIRTGKKPTEILDSNEGQYPYINAGLEPSGWVSEANAEPNCITIPSRGVGGAGKVGYQDGSFWGGPLCYQIRSATGLYETKFLYYYLLSKEDEILRLRKTGGMAAVNKSDLAEIRIPVLPIGEQFEIVHKVEQLRLLLTSETDGIGAELRLRRKQFEYYRDRLLDFPEKAVS